MAWVQNGELFYNISKFCTIYLREMSDGKIIVEGQTKDRGTFYVLSGPFDNRKLAETWVLEHVY